MQLRYFPSSEGLFQQPASSKCYDIKLSIVIREAYIDNFSVNGEWARQALSPIAESAMEDCKSPPRDTVYVSAWVFYENNHVVLKGREYLVLTTSDYRQQFARRLMENESFLFDVSLMMSIKNPSKIRVFSMSTPQLPSSSEKFAMTVAGVQANQKMVRADNYDPGGVAFEDERIRVQHFHKNPCRDKYGNGNIYFLEYYLKIDRETLVTGDLVNSLFSPDKVAEVVKKNCSRVYEIFAYVHVEGVYLDKDGKEVNENSSQRTAPFAAMWYENYGVVTKYDHPDDFPVPGKTRLTYRPQSRDSRLNGYPEPVQLANGGSIARFQAYLARDREVITDQDFLAKLGDESISEYDRALMNEFGMTFDSGYFSDVLYGQDKGYPRDSMAILLAIYHHNLSGRCGTKRKTAVYSKQLKWNQLYGDVDVPHTKPPVYYWTEKINTFTNGDLIGWLKSNNVVLGRISKEGYVSRQYGLIFDTKYGGYIRTNTESAIDSIIESQSCNSLIFSKFEENFVALF
jgi:hypothetical protein